MSPSIESNWEKSGKYPLSPEAPKISLDDALRESGAVVMEEGTSYSIPGSEAFSGLSEMLAMRMMNFTERCTEFLSYPVIADTFADHAERKEWRTKIAENADAEIVRFFEENRLRQNKIATLVNVAPTLKRMVDAESAASPLAAQFQPSMTEITEVIGNAITFGDRYNQMALEEKIEFVLKLSTAARDYLAVVSRNAFQSQQAA